MNAEAALPDEAAVGGVAWLPRVRPSWGRLLAFLLAAVSVGLFAYLVAPKLLGLRQTWRRIDGGDPRWLGPAAGLEVLSFLSYIALFRVVLGRGIGAERGPGALTGRGRSSAGHIGASDESRAAPGAAAIASGAPRIGWRESYQITLASLAATRLFAAAGAGGMALTAWALRRAGLGPRTVAARMLAFLALLYGVYLAALMIGGLGLYLGVFAGPAPFGLTVLPALLAAALIALFVALTTLPRDLERLVLRRTAGWGRVGRALRWLAAVSATGAVGVRIGLGLVRTAPREVVGALGWWGFDIAVLWACLHAFGRPPTPAVIVVAYLLGMLGNALPLPGGIGGVDGGMIGALSVFGVNLQLAVVAVLAYRVFAFWLPTLPGALAYLQLRRTVRRWAPPEVPARRLAAPAT